MAQESSAIASEAPPPTQDPTPEKSYTKEVCAIKLVEYANGRYREDVDTDLPPEEMKESNLTVHAEVYTVKDLDAKKWELQDSALHTSDWDVFWGDTLFLPTTENGLRESIKLYLSVELPEGFKEKYPTRPWFGWWEAYQRDFWYGDLYFDSFMPWRVNKMDRKDDLRKFLPLTATVRLKTLR